MTIPTADVSPSRGRLERRLHSVPLQWRWLTAALIGGLGALAFAPVQAVPLWPVSFALLVLMADDCRRAGAAFALGWGYGFGQFLLGFIWIAEAFQFQSALPASAGIGAVMLLAAALAVYPALAVMLAVLLIRPGLGRMVGLAALWMVGEWLRGTLLTGFPWNLAGTALLPLLPLAQVASLIGSYGLSLVLALFGVALAALAMPRVRSWSYIGSMAGLLALMTGFGSWRLYSQPTEYWPAQQVHIVQANIGQDEKWQDDDPRANLRAHLELTDQAVSIMGPGIGVWPETAIRNFIDEEPTTRFLMSRHIQAPGVILSGGIKVERDALGYAIAARNSLFALDPSGFIRARYDKAHLVPFGEYLPFRPLMERLGLARLAPGGLDFWPGPGPQTLDIPGVPFVGVLICYEVIFPGRVTDPDARPDWLLNISNDGWFGLSFGPYQHLAQARMRSIEEGLPLIRSTLTGISAVIDSHGRLLAQLGLQKQGVLSHDLPKPIKTTLYGVSGDWPAIIVAFMLVIFLTVGSLTHRRESGWGAGSRIR